MTPAQPSTSTTIPARKDLGVERAKQTSASASEGTPINSHTCQTVNAVSIPLPVEPAGDDRDSLRQSRCVAAPDEKADQPRGQRSRRQPVGVAHRFGACKRESRLELVTLIERGERRVDQLVRDLSTAQLLTQPRGGVPPPAAPILDPRPSERRVVDRPEPPRLLQRRCDRLVVVLAGPQLALELRTRLRSRSGAAQDEAKRPADLVRGGVDGRGQERSSPASAGPPVTSVGTSPSCSVTFL